MKIYARSKAGTWRSRFWCSLSQTITRVIFRCLDHDLRGYYDEYRVYSGLSVSWCVMNRFTTQWVKVYERCYIFPTLPCALCSSKTLGSLHPSSWSPSAWPRPFPPQSTVFCLFLPATSLPLASALHVSRMTHGNPDGQRPTSLNHVTCGVWTLSANCLLTTRKILSLHFTICLSWTYKGFPGKINQGLPTLS